MPPEGNGNSQFYQSDWQYECPCPKVSKCNQRHGGRQGQVLGPAQEGPQRLHRPILPPVQQVHDVRAHRLWAQVHPQGSTSRRWPLLLTGQVRTMETARSTKNEAGR